MTGIHRFIDGYQGSLWRKSQLNGAWKLRYFVLEKKKIKCYEDANCDKLISEVTLFNDTVLYDVPNSSEERTNLLYITVSGVDDVYYLSAETEEEKLNWLEAMSDAMHNGFKAIKQPSLGIEPFYPSIDLCITYENSSFHANNNNKLKPQNLENPPDVELRFGNNTSIYSLIMIDLDSVRANKERNSVYLHWAIVNIEGTDITSGLEIASYESPAPEYNTGLHRYMFLLFDQASDFTPDQFEDLDEMFQHRDAFSHLELMKQFHLGHPVGINGFYSTWDAHCDVLHQRMQYAPLSEYFSPTQAVSAATARAERARAALFREFVLGDIFPMDAAEFNAPAPPGGIALIIEYDDDYVVEDGQIIPPTYTRTEPSVSYTPHPVAVDAKGRPAECNMYTLLLVDPDAPSRINHSMREHVKWVVLNISEDRVSQGVPALPYLSPDPAYASGLHRYVFALFKQKREFSAKEVEDSKAFFAPRSGIISYDWVKAQGSVLHGVPVGVEAFLSEWDQSIDEIHKAAGYMPPPQYRSPAQKRAVIVAEGGARPGNLFSPKSGGRNNVEVDDIHQRLKKIQEAQTRFNSQVTETTARTSALEIASQKTRAEEASRLEEQSARSTENAASEENFQQQEQRATKKVAPRAPIVMSGTSKTLSASASQGLAVNIGDSLASDGGGGTSAAEAALLASNANDELIQVSQTKETTQSATTDVSTSQQTDSSAVQQNTTSNVQDTKVYHAGVQVSEEHSEQSTEQHTETHEEKRKDYRSQKVSQSHSVGKGNNMNTNAIENGGRPLSVPKLPLGSTLEQHVQEQEQEQVQKQTQEQAQQQQQEAHDRFERAMLYDQQQAAAAVAEQQRIELEAQEDARRAQQALIQKQQQEVLERQKLEQQRALEQQQRLLEEQQQQQKRQQQLPIPPVQQQMLSQQQSPSPRAPPRKQRSHNEFFGGIPDSEYSDTDASAYDSASVFSGPPQQPSRYNYLQQSTSNSGILPSISSQRSADENEEFSDTSSSFVARPAFDTSSNSRRPASGKPAFVVDPVTRYKLIMEGIVQSKTTPQLCDLFNVSTQSIFTGEKMKKKLSNDFMFKDSFLWIVPRTRSLHWSKGKLDVADSKYLLLDPLNGADPTAPPKGEMKGIVKRVRVSGPNLLITIESGDFLELKLSADGNPPAVSRATDWASVIKAYSQS